MLKFDRIVLVVLALGVWALVLKPQEIGAHDDDSHGCFIDGNAIGEAYPSRDGDIIVRVYHWAAVTVDCSHY